MHLGASVYLRESASALVRLDPSRLEDATWRRGLGYPRGMHALTQQDYERLRAFRTELRRFLAWSGQQAEAGLTLTQYQLPLAVRGHPDPRRPTSATSPAISWCATTARSSWSIGWCRLDSWRARATPRTPGRCASC
jgi:hypothetical protein